jgi:hypothetical protein
VGFDKIGHCPHDEAPELVNPFLLEFLEELDARKPKKKKIDILSMLNGVF